MFLLFASMMTATDDRTHEDSGAKFAVPAPAKIGPMR
jgi:hypothetical protein